MNHWEMASHEFPHKPTLLLHQGKVANHSIVSYPSSASA